MNSDADSEPDYFGQHMEDYLRSPLSDHEMLMSRPITAAAGSYLSLENCPDLLTAEQGGDVFPGTESKEDIGKFSAGDASENLYGNVFLDLDDVPSNTTCSVDHSESQNPSSWMLPSPHDEGLPRLWPMSPEPPFPTVSLGTEIHDKQLYLQTINIADLSSQTRPDSINSVQSPQQIGRWRGSVLSQSRPNESGLAKDKMIPRSLLSIADSDDLKDKERTECNCLRLTARLLEELYAKGASAEPVAMDVLLGRLRKALVHCTTTLECKRCTSLSEHNMLLAMAGRYMSTICERIVAIYLSLRSSAEEKEPSARQSSQADAKGQAISNSMVSGANLNPHETPTEKTTLSRPNNGGSSGDGDMWFSTYRIESGSERMQVLRCLVVVQLAELSHLLEKVRARAGTRKGHLAPLLEAEKRLQSIGLQLSRQRRRTTA